MRAIDGDILEKKLKDAINICVSIDTSGLSELKAVLEDVEEMPTIEPEPQIVQCEDCKYNSNTCGNYVNCDIIPQMFGRTADNYCSMAKRKEGTDESD